MTEPCPGRGGPWVILVPLKPLAAAKTRLARPDRPALALAMAMDTVGAALAAGSDVVATAVVVTNDPGASSVFTRRVPGRERVAVVPDLPAGGLNEALRHAAGVAGSRWPGFGVAALSADLAALRPVELRRALLAAPTGGRGVVADTQGTGTVLLTASPGTELRPAFGPGSYRAHIASGALDLTARLGPGIAGLRRDVDTLADLDAARRLGVGPATAEVLAAPICQGHPPASRVGTG